MTFEDRLRGGLRRAAGAIETPVSPPSELRSRAARRRRRHNSTFAVVLGGAGLAFAVATTFAALSISPGIEVVAGPELLVERQTPRVLLGGPTGVDLWENGELTRLVDIEGVTAVFDDNEGGLVIGTDDGSVGSIYWRPASGELSLVRQEAGLRLHDIDRRVGHPTALVTVEAAKSEIRVDRIDLRSEAIEPIAAARNIRRVESTRDHVMLVATDDSESCHSMVFSGPDGGPADRPPGLSGLPDCDASFDTMAMTDDGSASALVRPTAPGDGDGPPAQLIVNGPSSTAVPLSSESVTGLDAAGDWTLVVGDEIVIVDNLTGETIVIGEATTASVARSIEAPVPSVPDDADAASVGPLTIGLSIDEVIGAVSLDEIPIEVTADCVRVGVTGSDTTLSFVADGGQRWTLGGIATGDPEMTTASGVAVLDNAGVLIGTDLPHRFTVGFGVISSIALGEADPRQPCPVPAQTEASDEPADVEETAEVEPIEPIEPAEGDEADDDADAAAEEPAAETDEATPAPDDESGDATDAEAATRDPATEPDTEAAADDPEIETLVSGAVEEPVAE